MSLTDMVGALCFHPSQGPSQLLVPSRHWVNCLLVEQVNETTGRRKEEERVRKDKELIAEGMLRWKTLLESGALSSESYQQRSGTFEKLIQWLGFISRKSFAVCLCAFESSLSGAAGEGGSDGGEGWGGGMCVCVWRPDQKPAASCPSARVRLGRDMCPPPPPSEAGQQWGGRGCLPGVRCDVLSLGLIVPPG